MGEWLVKEEESNSLASAAETSDPPNGHSFSSPALFVEADLKNLKLLVECRLPSYPHLELILPDVPLLL